MGKSVTIKDVATLAGVSLGTMSNYLNGTKVVSSATRARIELAIKQTKFVPNRSVRSLHGNRTHTLALLVPDAANPFFAELARGVEDIARARGYLLIYCDTAGDEERQRHYVRDLAEMRVGGLIISSGALNPPNVGELEHVETPVVVVGQEGMTLSTSSVVINQHHGGYLAMRHLLDLGHRRVLFAGGPGGSRALQARYEGALLALRESGADPSLLTRVDATGRTIRERSALADIITAMDPRPTGVLCGNDMIAIAIVNRLTREGWSIPADIAIVGYDDISDAQLAVVPLTTVKQPAYEIGEAAARLLFAKSESPDAPNRRISFTPELVVRESTVMPGRPF
ncbi:LacI family DNA-binding transcriptional regulator [Arthrobacter sp. StoSoilB5]|uniref:LacI family DNA-binding transcriptional regulator n=1 Tax=Arthrobacter sp. StoSoilB5 TaxID=2830992 RepID=UPI001CC5124D|nr:LacI family DNA-binding transcriptional regulator [Arthrobacter sp. StoSoilB5]BCW44841.1 LacI family transcriptional regulator [Arthrobacter sp. StoSoilB5]